MTWQPENAVRVAGQAVQRRLALIGESVVNQIKLNISKPWPPGPAGDFPHVDTGRLRNSIFWVWDGDWAIRIGTNVEYALYLEYGTENMPPRPFLRRTIWAMHSYLNSIIQTGVA